MIVCPLCQLAPGHTKYLNGSERLMMTFRDVKRATKANQGNPEPPQARHAPESKQRKQKAAATRRVSNQNNVILDSDNDEDYEPDVISDNIEPEPRHLPTRSRATKDSRNGVETDLTQECYQALIRLRDEVC